MRILYAVTTCSDRTYRELFADAPVKPAFQSQKYHRLLIEGLAAHTRVEVIANAPVNRAVLKKPFLRLAPENEGGAHYRYLPAVRDPICKALVVGFGTFGRTLAMADRDSAVVVDCLNRVTALAAMAAARLRRRPCVGIVTDLPDMLGGGGFSKGLANFVIRHCTGYVLLTEAMNGYLNPKGKPYVILEGHADIAMERKTPDPEKKIKPRVCLYAGGVSQRYGLDNLVEGFLRANPANAELHIYGPGDYVPRLRDIAWQDSRVVYGGMLLSSQIVDKEMEATLLVNPRPTDEEYVKYSFPSKTMEYMASGTPVLTTVLPGMPREYHPYVYLIEDESAQGVADALKQVLEHSDEELFEKGRRAREFILREKNNVIQAGKILHMLESMEQRR